LISHAGRHIRVCTCGIQLVDGIQGVDKARRHSVEITRDGIYGSKRCQHLPATTRNAPKYRTYGCSAKPRTAMPIISKRQLKTMTKSNGKEG
jgi:hypothetical protein